jgi:hypothetical protein
MNGHAGGVVAVQPAARSRFSPTEDELLLQIRRMNPNLRWDEIGMRMGRTGRQVRERYQNYLSPALDRSKWTEKEDDLLRRAYEEHGPRWSFLQAQFFPYRAVTNVKNRHATLLSQDSRTMWNQLRNQENNEPQDWYEFGSETE